MPNAEEASSFLKGVTSEADALYDHLTKVLLKVVKEKPVDAYTSFEALSMSVKGEGATAEPAQEADNEETKLAGVQSTLDLLRPPKKKNVNEDGEEEEEEEEAEKAPIPNIMQDALMLAWAGVGLNEEECFKLMLSVQTLATKNELQNVRVWGKVTGTSRDYYVVEARQDEYPEPEDGSEPPKKQEPMGTGCNECIYFATNSPEEAWVKLPPVQPEHINVSRASRRFLTGDLSAPVLGFPRFPWGEAACLRACIARITADTVLCPVGQMIAEGEEDEEQTVAENEEWAGVDVLWQADGSKWLLARSGIMTEGRTTPWVDPDKEEEEEEEEEEDGEMSEEKKVKLAAIEKPRKKLLAVGELAEGSWGFRTAPNAYDRNAVSTCHSMLWPGAVAVARGKRVLNMYLGNGLPYLSEKYTPPAPPAFQNEYATTAELPEGTADPIKEQTDPVPPEGTPIEDAGEEVLNDDDDDGDAAPAEAAEAEDE